VVTLPLSIRYSLLTGIAYIAIITLLFPGNNGESPDIVYGLTSLWHPGVILFMQVLWLTTFVYSGRSMVTGSLVSIHLRQERIEVPASQEQPEKR